MSFPLVQRRLLPAGSPYAPTISGETVLGRIGTDTPVGERVIGASCRVIVAGDGNGTVELGITGDTDAFMITANVGSGVAGKKVAAGGADLAGNGTEYTSAINIVAEYTKGTDSTTPKIRFCLLVVSGDTWDDMLNV
ncbi:hypothetical protein LCGC14_1331550 [marine sediment metagenome]|uniref:Uncharacterized protein n=1 Tax=marine sediment metagenome TaxID=412755 RepID=A0A0F9NIW2_9ZZZZ